MNPIQKVLARTVRMTAPGSVPVVFTIDGTELHRKACVLQKEKWTSQLGAGGYQADDVLDETIKSEIRFTIPVLDLPFSPPDGTPVLFKRKTYFTAYVHDEGAVFIIGLVSWRA